MAIPEFMVENKERIYDFLYKCALVHPDDVPAVMGTLVALSLTEDEFKILFEGTNPKMISQAYERITAEFRLVGILPIRNEDLPPLDPEG